MPMEQQERGEAHWGDIEDWRATLWDEDDRERERKLQDQHRKVAALSAQLGPAAVLSELREAGQASAAGLDQERAIVWDVLEAVRAEECICWCEDALCECVMCTFIMRVREWWYEIL